MTVQASCVRHHSRRRRSCCSHRHHHYCIGLTEFDFFKFGRSQIWPNFGTQSRPKPKPNLAETCFLVREQYASDKTNGVNNAVSRYRGSTVQCFLCCIIVCQLLIK